LRQAARCLPKTTRALPPCTRAVSIPLATRLAKTSCPCAWPVVVAGIDGAACSSNKKVACGRPCTSCSGAPRGRTHKHTCVGTHTCTGTHASTHTNAHTLTPARTDAHTLYRFHLRRVLQRLAGLALGPWSWLVSMARPARPTKKETCGRPCPSCSGAPRGRLR
jgi:hypothetical protein